MNPGPPWHFADNAASPQMSTDYLKYETGVTLLFYNLPPLLESLPRTVESRFKPTLNIQPPAQ